MSCDEKYEVCDEKYEVCLDLPRQKFPARTTSEFGSQSRDSSVERPRDREPQPSTSGCASTAPGSMFVPQSRNSQSLESSDSDDESSDRELSGEVRTILSSKGNVRQGVRSKAV